MDRPPKQRRIDGESRAVTAIHGALYDVDFVLYAGNRMLDQLQDFGESKVSLAFFNDRDRVNPRWIKWRLRSRFAVRSGTHWYFAYLDTANNRWNSIEAHLHRAALGDRFTVTTAVVKWLTATLDERARMTRALRELLLAEARLESKSGACARQSLREGPSETVAMSEGATPPSLRDTAHASARIARVHHDILQIERLVAADAARIETWQKHSPEVATVVFEDTQDGTRVPRWCTATRDAPGARCLRKVTDSTQFSAHNFINREVIGSHWRDYLAALRRMRRLLKARAALIDGLRELQLAEANLIRQSDALRSTCHRRAQQLSTRVARCIERHPSERRAQQMAAASSVGAVSVVSHRN